MSKLTILLFIMMIMPSQIFAQAALEDIYIDANNELFMDGADKTTSRGSEVKDALSQIGGVQVWEDPLSGQPQVSIRGSRNSHINIYIDDVLATNSMGTSEQSLRIPMAMIESITIYKENLPVQYQSAIGGVIVIKTKSNASFAGVSAGSFDTYKTDLMFSKKVFKKDHFSTWGYWQRSQNDYPYVERSGTLLNKEDDFETKRKNSEKKNIGLGAKFEKNLTRQKLTFYSSYLENEANLPPASTLLSAYANLKEKQQIASVNWDFFRDDYRLGIKLSNVNKRINYSDKQSALSLTALDSATTIESRPIEIGMSYGFEHFILSPQFFLRNQELKSNQNSLLEKIQRDEKNYGLEVIYFNQGWNVTAMAKHLEYEDKGRVDREDDAFQHSIGIGYQFKKSALKFSATTVATFPELWQIQGDRGYVRSNPNLKSEKKDQYDLGYQFEFSTASIQWQMQTKLFLKQMTDGIFIIYNSQGIGVAKNISKGEVQGLEYSLTSYWEKFVFNLTYTYQEALNKTSVPVFSNKFLPNIYEHDLQTNLTYSYQKLTFGYRFYYLYNMYYDDVNLIAAKPYEGHDLTVHFQQSASIWSISLQNIFDQRLETANSLQGKGRSFEVTYQFLF